MLYFNNNYILLQSWYKICVRTLLTSELNIMFFHINYQFNKSNKYSENIM